MNFADFLKRFTSWAEEQSDIVGVALVGSYANLTATAVSDVDLIILSTNREQYFRNQGWLSLFGAVTVSKTENWGRVETLRVIYEADSEIEYNFAAPSWADVPIDAGTKRVVEDGLRVLFDREQRFKLLQQRLLAEKNQAMPGMELHGQAMLDYLNGDKDASYILRRDDGVAYPPIYARQFFYPDGLPVLDQIAINQCVGRVLDIGAGAGSHSLAIQSRGLDVTSVEVSEKAVQVMRQRGCKNAIVGDVFDSYAQPFDTVLVILNIGIVGKLEGLNRFLRQLDGLLTETGRLITDSIDPRNSEDESYQEYVQIQAAKGYMGERTLRFEYKDQVSDWFEWMHIDPETLAHCVDANGYAMKTLGKDGKRYLVSIVRKDVSPKSLDGRLRPGAKFSPSAPPGEGTAT